MLVRLPRKAAGCRDNLAKGEYMHIITSKATEAGLPKPFGNHISPPCGPDSGNKVTKKIWLGLGLALASSLLSTSLLFPCGMEIFTLIYWICVICFWFLGAHSQEFALSLRGGSGAMLKLRRWDSWRWAKCILHCKINMSFWGPRMEYYGFDMKCLPKFPVLIQEYSEVRQSDYKSYNLII